MNCEFVLDNGHICGHPRAIPQYKLCAKHLAELVEKDFDNLDQDLVAIKTQLDGLLTLPILPMAPDSKPGEADPINSAICLVANLAIYLLCTKKRYMQLFAGQTVGSVKSVRGEVSADLEKSLRELARSITNTGPGWNNLN